MNARIPDRLVAVDQQAMAPEILRKRREGVDLAYGRMKDRLFRVCAGIVSRRGVGENELLDLASDLLREVGTLPEMWLERSLKRAASDHREEFLVEHSLNVAILAGCVAPEMELEEEVRIELTAGALVHDIGMFEVPKDVLVANRPLSDSEKRIIRAHPELGRELLRASKVNGVVSRIVHQEQERLDGTGYPQGLKGSGIDHLACVVGFCDTLESVTHDRPHRSGRSFADALQQLLHAGRGIFPKDLWIAALRRVTPYPPGTGVRLSTGRVARVVRTHPEAPLRPVVELVSEGISLKQPRVLDLRHLPMVHITARLDLSSSFLDSSVNAPAQ
ncbi:MAG: HD domain-containing protein [Nitrospirae bacterium]|nr:HD domain-containing protein [Nitrospirota bacterium]